MVAKNTDMTTAAQACAKHDSMSEFGVGDWAIGAAHSRRPQFALGSSQQITGETNYMVTRSRQENVPLLVQLGAISAELLHNVFLAIQLLLGIICSFLQPLNLHSKQLIASAAMIMFATMNTPATSRCK